MNSKEIRQKWLDFFASKQHVILPSKSLVPQNDPSLLWINSGVATLKDYFAGKKIPPAKRLANSQKAIRTNDIENVGITARHHTFFEMLGNFSIGDYFKKEAISFAYEFLIDVLKLPKEKLYFTYFHEDLETKNYWMAHGFDESHLIPGTRDTNFWEVGSGPCGPNTEIFYDRGDKYDDRGIICLQQDLENDRYIEIWNIVFSTYNSNGEGVYTELRQKNIDTGAGLERIASILQDAPTNFDTDLFLPIIHEIEKYTTKRYEIQNYFIKDPNQTEINTSFKIIADHMRTVVNAIADGAKVSNVGRGYILRRLIRRSVYKAMQLGIYEPFLHNLVEVIKNSLPFEYEIAPIAQVIYDEELTFSKTIENGKELLASYIQSDIKIFPGHLAFKLFETYGFPIELTSEILAQQGIEINYQEFEAAKEKHAEASRNSKLSGMDKVINSLTLLKAKEDEFIGYSHLENKTKILHLLNTETEIEQSNGIAYLVLAQTPFYATSGGQKHDRGYILQGKNKLQILDVFKDKFGNHIHKVEGKVTKHQEVQCFVDPKIRLGLERNHSGTHLLFCALRHVLGNQIKQLGSDNNEERLTFDLPADKRPSDSEILKIEQLVRLYIAKDAKREYLTMTTEEAKKIGAIMTLEEAEYMDPKAVRIVKFNEITADLCGGTHLSNTAKLENFKITHVEKKAAGVYRIRAISSNLLVNEYLEEENDKLLTELNKVIEKNEKLNSNYILDLNIPQDKEQALDYLKTTLEQAKTDNKQLNKQAANNIVFDLNTVKFQNIKNTKVAILSNLDPKQIKAVASTLRETHPDALIIAYSNDENPTLVVASKVFNSNTIAQELFKQLKGRGGGNAILAMGKIVNKPSNLEVILKELKWEN